MSEPFYHDPAFRPYMRSCGPGSLIYRQGSTEGHIAILVRGVLEVARDGYLVAEIVEPGAILGEMGLILNQPASATVTALTDAELIVVPRSKLSEVSVKIPAFAVRMMKTLATRLQASNERIAELETSYDQLYNQIESSGAMKGDTSGVYAAQTQVVESPLTMLEDLKNEISGPGSSAEMEAVQLAREVNLPEQTEKGRQPLLPKRICCPVHSIPEAFPIYLLRKGSQAFARDRYGITDYRAGKDGYAPIDYTLQEVLICPACHFASNLPDNFLPDTRGKGSSGGFMIRRSVRDVLEFGLDVRKALVETLPEPEMLFGPARDVRTAGVAYELAMITARAFWETDKTVFSTWGFRLIVYNLKLAQIHRKYRSPETERVYLGRALDLVRDNLGQFGGAQYFYTYFLAVALAQRLEGNKQAEKYLETFRVLRERSLERLEPNLAMLATEYYQKAQSVLDGADTPDWKA